MLVVSCYPYNTIVYKLNTVLVCFFNLICCSLFANSVIGFVVRNPQTSQTGKGTQNGCWSSKGFFSLVSPEGPRMEQRTATRDAERLFQVSRSITGQRLQPRCQLTDLSTTGAHLQCLQPHPSQTGHCMHEYICNIYLRCIIYHFYIMERGQGVVFCYVFVFNPFRSSHWS